MFSLPALPYEIDALAPHMSAETLMLHHDRHHRSYVEKLNAQIEGTPFADKTLDAIIAATRDDRAPDRVQVFNNAGQHWNHSLFWQSLSPRHRAPDSKLAGLIERDFGSPDRLCEEFHGAGMDHFGSGWVWLVQRETKLSVVTTHDAQTPAGTDATALLCCDLWEHAYYLDHRDRRADFLHVFLQHLVNWAFAESRLTEMVRS